MHFIRGLRVAEEGHRQLFEVEEGHRQVEAGHRQPEEGHRQLFDLSHFALEPRFCQTIFCKHVYF